MYRCCNVITLFLLVTRRWSVSTHCPEKNTQWPRQELACIKDVPPKWLIEVRVSCTCACVSVHVYCMCTSSRLVSWCVLCFLGLNIKQVAHDYATLVTMSSMSYSFSIPMTLGMVCIEMYLNMICILFLCKGTNNVAKAMKKIAQGAIKWEGTKWFGDLSDKCMYVYMYLLSEHLWALPLPLNRQEHQDPHVLGHEKLWWW